MFGNRLSGNARRALPITALTIGLIGISAGPAAASRSCGTISLKHGGSACWRGANNTARAREVVDLTLLFGVARAASSSSSARVTTRATSAAACARERVNGGKFLGQLTLRFGLIGHVSCAEAHRLASTYFHKFATGQCGQQNNFCDLTFNGWNCSLFFATEVQQTGGAKAGCAREHGGARVRFYWASAQQHAAERSASPSWRAAA